MAIPVGPITLMQELGLYALAGLIPLILIYLIRPRPKELNLPSLMFFMRVSDKLKTRAFLRKFTRDWLFFIQLLILLLLAFHLMSPVTKYQHDVTAENTVIVLDISASSQTKEGTKTRFQKSVDQALSSLGGSNTIILAKDVALMGIENVPYREARDYLKSLKPLDTGSKIGDALVLAGEAIGGREGRIIVISDFINTNGMSPHVARSVIESKGVTVDFINVAGGKRNNIGIIDMSIDEETTTVYVKNYNNQIANVNIKIGASDKILAVAPGSIEPYTFTTPKGITKVELMVNDDLAIDNTVHISVPLSKKKKVLLASNNASVFLKNALNASEEVELTVTEPPVVPTGDFDIYVFQGVEPRKILPGTFEEIRKEVEEGASLIIHAQQDMGSVDYRGLLPVSILGTSSGGSLRIDQLNTFTKHVEAQRLSIGEYHLTEPLAGAISIASAWNSSLMAFKQLGRGKVFYYGIMDKSSEFKFSPQYPIFWTSLLGFLTDDKSIENLNSKTGSSLILNKVTKIETPDKTVSQSTLIFERSGIYKLPDQNIAVNLLNDKESDINAEEEVGEKIEDFKLEPIKEEREFSLEIPLLIAVMVLLCLEIAYVKFRGEV